MKNQTIGFISYVGSQDPVQLKKELQHLIQTEIHTGSATEGSIKQKAKVAGFDIEDLKWDIRPGVDGKIRGCSSVKFFFKARKGDCPITGGTFTPP